MQEAIKITLGSILSNVVLSLIKMLAGIFGHSAAMISDAVHSLSDVFSSIIVIVGLKISAKEADEEHQYGHERIECVFAIVLAMVLCFTGLMIGKSGLETIIDKSYLVREVPEVIAIYAAVLSIFIKEIMFQVTARGARKMKSPALMADAWHHRSDALSSVGALFGTFAARHGYLIFEPIASLVICLFIFKAAYDIFIDAVDKLVDKACDLSFIEEVKDFVKNIEGVCAVDSLKTRQFGSKIYVDIEISADGNLTLNEAHEIAAAVHHQIEDHFEGVKHCMVHINPYNE